MEPTIEHDRRSAFKITRVVRPDVKTVKVIVKDPDFNEKAEGIAKCHPNDEFDAGIGTEIAMARALKKLLGVHKWQKWE